MICLEERASEASHVDTWHDYTSQDRKILQASKFMWCFASKLKRCSIRWLKCLKTPCSCVEESISIWRVGNCAKKTCWSSLVIYFAVKTYEDMCGLCGWKSEGHILWSLNYTEFMFRAHPETHEYLRGQREAIAAAGSVGTRVSRHPLGAQWTSGDWWIATRGQVMKQKVWRTDKFDMPYICLYHVESFRVFWANVPVSCLRSWKLKLPTAAIAWECWIWSRERL